MSQSTAVENATPAHRGTVFDIGYQRYEGVREGRSRSRRAIYKDGVRTALGLGRGGRAKILPWLFLSVLSGMAFIMALVAGAAERLAGPGAAERLNLPSHSDFYGMASALYFVFASVVAPELLCPDKRNGVINLYLVRPMTGTDYIAPKWFSFFTIMLVAAWLPQLILFLGLSMGDPKPIEYLTKHWLDIPRFLLSGSAIAAFMTTFAMMVSSFTTRRAYASVFLVGLFLISAPFTLGVSQEIGGKLGQWISMFSFTNIPLHVNDVIFNDTSELTEDAPARKLGSTMLVSWFFLCTIVPGTVLWARYRRLAA